MNIKLKHTSVIVALAVLFGSFMSLSWVQSCTCLDLIPEESACDTSSHLANHSEAIVSWSKPMNDLEDLVSFVDGSSLQEEPTIRNESVGTEVLQLQESVCSSLIAVAIDSYGLKVAYEAPEPSTSAMIGLGCFAVILRRRH